MNNFEPVAVIVLTAGLGKRMNSDAPKVMVEADGAPIIDYVLEAASMLKPVRTVIVTGHKRELVESHVTKRFPGEKISFAFQERQCGTGDAVKVALPNLKDFSGSVVIIYGDIPLLLPKTLDALLALHRQEAATVTLLSVNTPNPAHYGRIMRNAQNQVTAIKEFKDCSAQERLVNEINSGIYVVDSAFLPGAVKQLKNNNAQGEFYLTDMIAQAAQEGQSLSCLVHFDLAEVQGVNNRVELAETTGILKQRRISALIEGGVLFSDPFSVDIERSVKIAPGTHIGGHVLLSGETTIEKGAIVEGFSVLHDTTVAQGAIVHQFVHAHAAVIGEGSTVGPFARLREGTVLAGDNKIGNFVETKKARLAQGAKASHLTYLGDCTIGERTNIGAGTITCNYDGVKKSDTTIGKDAFIGSDLVLIAPVTVGDGAYIGAGSTITKNVEADSLALTRTEQKSIPGWAAKRKKKN